MRSCRSRLTSARARVRCNWEDSFPDGLGRAVSGLRLGGVEGLLEGSARGHGGGCQPEDAAARFTDGISCELQGSGLACTGGSDSDQQQPVAAGELFGHAQLPGQQEQAEQVRSEAQQKADAILAKAETDAEAAVLGSARTVKAMLDSGAAKSNVAARLGLSGAEVKRLADMVAAAPETADDAGDEA